MESVATATHAVRTIRKYDDDFFHAGNELTYDYSDVIISYVEEEEDYDDDDDDDDDDSETENDGDCEYEEEQSLSLPLSLFQCSMPHCNETFESIASYEAHYEKNHVFQCSQPRCKLRGAALPNEHLLDLHIQESHDAYFQTMLEHYSRPRPCSSSSPSSSPHPNQLMTIMSSSQNNNNSGKLYQCLVESCKERFQNDVERCHHLNLMHGYPKWFRFHSRAKKKKKKSSHSHLRSRSRQKSRKMHANNENNSDNLRMSMENHDHDHDRDRDRDHEKKEKRRARRKAKNKNIPCRFFHSKRGCRKGDKCMFLHDDTGGGLSLSEIEISNTDSITLDNDHDSYGDGNDNGNENGNVNVNAIDMDIDEEIDELATQIRAKASISFPAKISFGRRRRI